MLSHILIYDIGSNNEINVYKCKVSIWLIKSIIQRQDFCQSSKNPTLPKPIAKGKLSFEPWKMTNRYDYNIKLNEE